MNYTTLAWAAKHISNVRQENRRADGYYKFHKAGVMAKVMLFVDLFCGWEVER